MLFPFLFLSGLGTRKAITKSKEKRYAQSDAKFHASLRRESGCWTLTGSNDRRSDKSWTAGDFWTLSDYLEKYCLLISAVEYETTQATRKRWEIYSLTFAAKFSSRILVWRVCVRTKRQEENAAAGEIPSKSPGL